MPSRYNYIEYYLARRFFSGQKFAPSVAVSPQNHAFRPEDAFGAARRRALRYARKHQRRAIAGAAVGWQPYGSPSWLVRLPCLAAFVQKSPGTGERCD